DKVLCFGSGTYDGVSYGAVIPAGCVGNPASFLWGGGVMYDTNASRDDAPTIGDGAPDGDALAGPVTAPPALDRSAGGYWLVGDDGGIFSFNTDFKGSTGAIKLSQPIVGMAADPDHAGYWFVAADGGIFSFGDAKFFGAAVGSSFPVVGITAAKDGQGYSIVRADGSVVNRGSAPQAGSLVGHTPSRPVAGIAGTL